MVSVGKLRSVHSMFKIDSQAVQWWVADGFRCRRCDGTIQEADLTEDLSVDGETYGCVKSCCYLGDTLDGDGGADLAATARVESEMDV